MPATTRRRHAGPGTIRISRPISWAALSALPAAFAIAVLWMRGVAGPFYLWHVADPSYIYLFDGLNLAEGAAPGNIYHPGTPAQMLAGLVLWLAHPAAGADALARAVLADAEGHLRLISDVLVAMVAAAILVAGAATYRAFGRLLPALIVQSAPFLSMLILKNAYHVKPEPLLIAATFATIAIAVGTLKPADADGSRTAAAVGFGAVAGFAVAAKLTAAPLALLPLFVLWQRRALVTYAFAALSALVVFTLPIAAQYGDMFGYFAKVAVSGGAYVQGAETVIDPAAYPEAVLKLFKRPLVSVPVALTLAVVIAAAWRERRRPSAARPAVRVAAGIAAVMVVQVLLVAKQPTAFYLIPSLVLGAFAIVTASDYLASSSPWSRGSRVGGRWLLGVAFAGLLIGQGFAVAKQGRELRTFRAEAANFTDGRFDRCAKVYFYSASVPAYALYLGDQVARARHGRYLRDGIGTDEFWLADFLPGRQHEVRDADGPLRLSDIAASFPCTVFRGLEARGSMRPFIAVAAPAIEIRDTCRSGLEVVMTAGTDCSGN